MKVNARSVPFLAAVWSSFLAVGLGSEAASAQQVEVVANETALRLDPDGASPVIATLEAGAVLEWVGESGPYYAVSVPGPPGQENLVGYVLASEVAVVGASRPGAPAPGPGAPGGGMAIPGVEEQHASAKASRSAGLNRAAQGAAVAATAQVSISIFYEAEEREYYETEAEYQAAKEKEEDGNNIKTVALIGAGALVAYGLGRYVLGWRKMAELEREFPEATTPPLDRQYAEASLNRSLGRRKALWGTLLAGASFATVEWVPHFADPKPEDYQIAGEFRDAVSRRENAEMARNWIMGAGGVLGVWGIAQWILASQRMGEVEELQRMTALPSPLRSLGPGSPVNLFVDGDGARTRFGVAWSW